MKSTHQTEEAVDLSRAGALIKKSQHIATNMRRQFKTTKLICNECWSSSLQATLSGYHAIQNAKLYIVPGAFRY
jgi:hypothetical protein